MNAKRGAEQQANGGWRARRTLCIRVFSLHTYLLPPHFTTMPASYNNAHVSAVSTNNGILSCACAIYCGRLSATTAHMWQRLNWGILSYMAAHLISYCWLATFLFMFLCAAEKPLLRAR